MIPEYNAETSGMICILLDWDDKRKGLIESICLAGIPVVVFVVVDPGGSMDLEPGPLTSHPERLIPLPCDRIQSALDDVNRFSLAEE